MTNPMMICHIIWMKKYAGPEAEVGAGGFKFALAHHYGHEMYNFRRRSGFVYGYIPFEHADPSINITKIGGKNGIAKGVDVLWTAPDPDGNGRVIVGWYRNAEVLAKSQHGPNKIKNTSVTYFTRTPANQARLLSTEDRTFIIPSAKSLKGKMGKGWHPGLGPGQSSVFFPDRNNPSLANRLRRYIDSDGVDVTKRKNKGAGWSVDLERRSKVERAAVNTVTLYLKKNRFTNITLREAEKIGWDLEAQKGAKVFCVEVKGRFGPEAIVELTPNEYKQLKLVEHGNFKNGAYRLAIVTSALSKPMLRLFAWRINKNVAKSKGLWECIITGNMVEVKERPGAVVTLLN
jgi:hypothetical protein